MIEEPIEAALSMAAHELAHAQIRVVRRYQSQRRPELRDSGQLEQVFLNLIINACHAMPEGGMLTIETQYVPREQEAGEIAVRITDTETGIKPEHLPHIFEPFFTTKGRSSDSKHAGTGLGLSVSQGIVAAHGGSLCVESRLGVGTTFELWLSSTDAFAAPPEKTPGAPAARTSEIRARGLRALLAEDEAPIRDAIASILEEEGYTVVAVDDATMAVAKLKQEDFDVVVTDLIMPGGGRKVLAAANHYRPHARVVLITGMLPSDIGEQMGDLGADAVIHKPFQIDDVLVALEKILAVTAE